VTPLARRSRPTRGRVPPWPPPSSLATAIASISGTPRCAQLWWTRRYPWPRRSCHRRRATTVALLPSPVLSLTSGAHVSIAARGREPTTGHAGERAAPLFWAALACVGHARSWAAHRRAGPVGCYGFDFCFLVIISQICMLFCKFQISRLVGPFEVIPSLLGSV
jgi:hypothetical protein